MSIKNYDLAKLISYCDLYNEEIEIPDYINEWKDMPLYTYNPNKFCRQLKEKKLIHHPIIRSSGDNIFNYKTNKPLDGRGITRYEAFSSNNNTSFFIVVTVVIVLIIILLLYKIKYHIYL